MRPRSAACVRIVRGLIYTGAKCAGLNVEAGVDSTIPWASAQLNSVRTAASTGFAAIQPPSTHRFLTMIYLCVTVIYLCERHSIIRNSVEQITNVPTRDLFEFSPTSARRDMFFEIAPNEFAFDWHAGSPH